MLCGFTSHRKQLCLGLCVMRSIPHKVFVLLMTVAQTQKQITLVYGENNEMAS